MLNNFKKLYLVNLIKRKYSGSRAVICKYAVMVANAVFVYAYFLLSFNAACFPPYVDDFFFCCLHKRQRIFFFFRIRLLRFRTGALLFCPVPFILWHEFSAAKSCNSCGAKYMDRTARCTHKMSAMWSAYHCKERETDTVHVTLEREWAGLQNCYWHCVIIITIIIIKLIFTGKWEICMNFFLSVDKLNAQIHVL